MLAQSSQLQPGPFHPIDLEGSQQIPYTPYTIQKRNSLYVCMHMYIDNLSNSCLSTFINTYIVNCKVMNPICP